MSHIVDWATFIDKIYPVGAIYSTVAQTTAAQVKAALGGVGTWVAWGAGRVPVGVDTSQTEFDTVEETGGEKTHKLTITEMPKHRHAPNSTTHPYFAIGTNASFHTTASGGGKGVENETTYTDYQGGDGAHNNLQPYITCYMWKRTA